MENLPEDQQRNEENSSPEPEDQIQLGAVGGLCLKITPALDVKAKLKLNLPISLC